MWRLQFRRQQMEKTDDFLTGVAFYGINEKEGKANVFGRETNIYRETNEI